LLEGGCYPHEDGFAWTDGELQLPLRFFRLLDSAFTLAVHFERPGMSYPLPTPLARVA
jgi:hypothetical protein